VVTQLTLPAAIAEQLLAHARAELPNEACGLLAGTRSGDAMTVLEFHPARNAAASPLRYDVHPEDLVRIVFGIEDAGRELVGIFHSHVASPAIPSATDLRAAQYPEACHLLASLADPEAGPEGALRAWTIRDGSATEVALRIGVLETHA
jgi:proteasome lid subunit RPN8/RPN11